MSVPFIGDSAVFVCSLVEIVNGQILNKTGSDAEEKWSSWTPSPYQMNVSETYSMLSLYSGPNCAELSSLVHTPLRPVRDCHALSSVVASGQSMDGTHISILAAVRHVRLYIESEICLFILCTWNS